LSVFSKTYDSGNPAAVCILSKDDFDNTPLMQKIAKRINFSEVAFLSFFNNQYLIRWFSPKKEVEICGHATIAAFELLIKRGLVDLNKWLLIKSKKYNFRLRKDSISNTIILRLPIFELKECPINKINDVIDVSSVLRVSSSNLDYICEINSLKNLRTVKVDFEKLIEVKKRGLIVSFLDSKSNHIYFRYFCPKLGFKEDPGTGSALSSLYTFWEKRVDFSKKVSFFQESRRKSRGFVEKLEKEDFLSLEAFVSDSFEKTLEID